MYLNIGAIIASLAVLICIIGLFLPRTRELYEEIFEYTYYGNILEFINEPEDITFIGWVTGGTLFVTLTVLMLSLIFLFSWIFYPIIILGLIIGLISKLLLKSKITKQ